MWEELTETSRKSYTSKAKKRFIRAAKRARRRLLQSAVASCQRETNVIFTSSVESINATFDRYNDHNDENNDIETEMISNNKEMQRSVQAAQISGMKYHGEKESAGKHSEEEGCNAEFKKDAAVTCTRLPTVTQSVPVYLDASAYAPSKCSRDRDDEVEEVENTNTTFHNKDKKCKRNGENSSMDGCSQSGSSSDNADRRGLICSSSFSSSSPSSSSFLSSADSSAASSNFSSASPSPIPAIRSLSPPLPLFTSKINGDVSEMNVIDSSLHRTCTYKKQIRNESKRKHSVIFLSNEKKINKFFSEKKDFVKTPESDNSLRSKNLKSRLDSGREVVNTMDLNIYISPSKSPEMRPAASPSYLSFLSSPSSHSHPHTHAAPHHKTPRVGSNYQITVGSYYDEVRGEAENDQYLESGTKVNEIGKKNSSTGCHMAVNESDSRYPSCSHVDGSINTMTSFDNCSSSSKSHSRNNCTKYVCKNGHSERALHYSLPLSGVTATTSSTSEDILNEGLVWTCSRKNYTKLLSDFPHNGLSDSLTAVRFPVSNTNCSNNNNLFSANHYRQECVRIDASPGAYHQKDIIDRSEVNIDGYVVCALNMIEHHRKHRVLRSKMCETSSNVPNTRCYNRYERHVESSLPVCVDGDNHLDDQQKENSLTLPQSLHRGSWIYLRTGALEHILETLHIW